MKKIYIACPASVATGGPELLHQLCHVLNKNGFCSFMYYTGWDGKGDPVHEAYKEYNNPYVTQYDDRIDNIIVVPETNMELLMSLKKSKKVFWWLSVDNFRTINISTWKRPFRKLKYLIDGFNNNNLAFISQQLNKILLIGQSNAINNKECCIKDSPEITHLVQSQYAKEYLKKIGIDNEKIFNLSDYINTDFLKQNNTCEKEDVILYNPKKGKEFTDKLIEHAPHLVWKPLINLTRLEMIQALKSAKIYIDFGNHPGKDRIPREACISGCCIITGKRGSANYFQDVPIQDKYKFDDNEINIPYIINRINEIFNNYESCYDDFVNYINMIKSEEKIFETDAITIFSALVE